MGDWQPEAGDIRCARIEKENETIVATGTGIWGFDSTIEMNQEIELSEIPDHKVLIEIIDANQRMLSMKCTAKIADFDSCKSDIENSKNSVKHREDERDPLRERRSEAMSGINSGHN